MDKTIKNFNPVSTELLSGINLIEASAGTGKTYAIAMLVLRYVVEKNLDIKQILVVTFTKAATEELKDRIRTRLVHTRQALIANDNNPDEILKHWLDKLGIEPELIIRRLNSALLDIDQAGIFTIHGFCQRILAEHALESGQLFDSELTGDISAIKQACSDDFWRKQVYNLSSWEACLLTTQYQTPDELLASVDFIASDLRIIPDYENLEQKLSELNLLIAISKQSLETSLLFISEKLSEGKFKKSFTENYGNCCQTLIDWLNKKSNTAPDFSLFTDQGLFNNLNGVKFKNSKTNPLSSEEQKLAYLNSLNIETEPFQLLDIAIKNITLFFRRSLLHTLHKEVVTRLQQLNVLSFDDLITRLATALGDKQGVCLGLEIQQRYQTVLIDEFQDTDQSQWFIFSTLFNSNEHALYLIGDPKQAIYKFRGADINSYFAAQKQAQHHFTLSQNWRSHPQLVEGVNTLFSRDKAFLSEQLDFNPVNAALSANDGALIEKEQELAPLVLWQLEQSEDGYWSSGKAANEIIIAVVNEILDLLTANFCIKSLDIKAIQAKDIAILVRSNPQAKTFQQTLNAIGITAVINSKDSVFLSAEAFDLSLLLQAIAQPANNTLLKQSLALDWFGLNGQILFQLLNDETTIDNWASRFQQYQQDWQNKGLMAMMQGLIEKEKIHSFLTKDKQAERRITNLQHCIELVQQAAIDEHLGINKTLDWLHNNITKANPRNTPSDEQQLRLESDEDAINIITMHSAKGLEYPIVFCPFLWQRGNRISQEKSVIKCYTNGEMIADLGSEKFEQHRTMALEEELAEDIRVCYVAITRAKYRCYINWADVRTKDKTNNSAIAYLLDFSENSFDTQQSRLKDLSNKQPSVFEYRLLETERELSKNYQPHILSNKSAFKQRHRSLYTLWQMSSYTALSSLSIHDETELPNDKARENSATEATKTKYSELPKGARTGNVIHDLLENNSFNTLAENNDISLQRDKSCLRFGLKTDRPEQIDQLLIHTISTPLSVDDDYFSLKLLDEQQCLKEMPFYLQMKTMHMNQINEILKDCPTFQPLSEKTMCGYLTGFIDLICQVNGKYYVIDYKSNSLETYSHEALVQSMREHNYGLQYWIYILVLHQYLQNKLPDYKYEQHIGGIKYLFVRGMNEKIENSGVYQTKPDIFTVEQLAQLFI